MSAQILKAIKEVGDVGAATAVKIKTLEADVAKVKAWGEKAAKNGETIFATPRDAKEEGKWGYKNFGEYAMSIKGSPKNMPPERLVKAYSHVEKAATGMGELVGSDGGFLVPPEFSDKIFERVYANDLLSRTDQYTIKGNSIVFPRNSESSRATGSRYGGVQTYWRQEGATPTVSKPGFGRLTLNLHKLISLAAVTDELLSDSPMALSQYLTRVFADDIVFMVGDSIYNGTGAGQPLGVINAPCLVSVAKEAGQSAATIVAQNIVKMHARLWAGNRANSVWLVNQDTFPQLSLMTLGIGTAGVAVYMPPGGLSDKPYATLMGRPVIEVEFAATLGTQGDIALVDLSQYVVAQKGGPDAQTSVHFYFDSDQTAFRMTYRMDGQPWWASALTPYKGTATQSMAVVLDTRA